MIDRYLDGKEHLFSKTGAQLATEVSHETGNSKTTRIRSSTGSLMVATYWILFLMAGKEELKRYQSEMEAAMDKYLEIIASGGHIFEAEKVFKEVSFPSYKFTIDNKLEISSSGGGLHTKR